MVKKCVQCGTLVDEGIRFCTVCGSGSFQSIIASDMQNETPTQGLDTIYDVPQQIPKQGTNPYEKDPTRSQRTDPYNRRENPDRNFDPRDHGETPTQVYDKETELRQGIFVDGSVYPQNSEFSQTPPKKQSNTVAIVLSVFGGFFALILIIVVIGIVLSDKDSSDTLNSFDDSVLPNYGTVDEINEPAIPYTKGEIIDDYYINEWANIKLPITEACPPAGEDRYSAYESEQSECGFLSVNLVTGSQVVIAYEALPDTFFPLTPDEYIDLTLEGFIYSVNQNGSLFTEGIRYDEVIGGEIYRVTYGEVSGITTVYVGIAARIYDNVAITILITNQDEAAVSEIFNSILPAN